MPDTGYYAERRARHAEALTGYHAYEEAKLRATPAADLLRAAYALTHRMDAVDIASPQGLGRLADLREQRDLIDAEVVRRTDG